jgi:hypothetical protein
MTSGGASDTELNELTVVPTSVPSAARAPMTAMPVANVPKAWRRRCGVKPCAGSLISGSGRDDRLNATAPLRDAEGADV